MKIDRKVYKLGDLALFVRGKTLPTSREEKISIPFLKVKNIQDGKIDMRDIDLVSEKSWKKCKILPGELLICTTGSTSGKIGINQTGQRFAFDCNLSKISLNDKVIQRKFLYYFLKSSYNKILQYVTFGMIPTLSVEELKDMVLSIPNMDIQKRIVSLLAPFAELELRQKQYRYYRDLLLREPIEDPLIKVQEYELGEVC